MKDKILEILKENSTMVDTYHNGTGIAVFEDDFEDVANEILNLIKAEKTK